MRDSILGVRSAATTVASFVAALGFCACVTTSTIAQTSSSSRPGPAASWPAGKSEQNVTMNEVLDAIRNRTNMTFGADGMTPPMTRYDARTRVTTQTPPTPYKGSGTQVEYFSADGKMYLWYPGSPIVWIGKWSLGSRPVAGGTAVTYCFTYDQPTRLPDSGPVIRGGTCGQAAYFYLSRIVETANGDIFELSRRSAPPFVLDRERTTLDALKARTGRP